MLKAMSSLSVAMLDAPPRLSSHRLKSRLNPYFSTTEQFASSPFA
jgi:hypothetical protein